MSIAESRDVGALCETVCALHAELVRNNLVAWTSGNVSARLSGSDLMVIKPSGVSYDDLTPASMVVCDLDGQPVSANGLSPSSDTATHAYIYRHLPGVGAVVHTHSTYATAWAARGEPIPCVITAMADEFGGEFWQPVIAVLGPSVLDCDVLPEEDAQRLVAPRRPPAPERLQERRVIDIV